MRMRWGLGFWAQEARPKATAASRPKAIVFLNTRRIYPASGQVSSGDRKRILQNASTRLAKNRDFSGLRPLAGLAGRESRSPWPVSLGTGGRP